MNLAEETFYLHLTDSSSMKFLVAEGVDLDILPTEALHPVWLFAERYYIANGLIKAPTMTVLHEEYADLLKDYEVDLGQDPEESIEWALEHLRSGWVYSQVATFQKELASDMAAAETDQRLEVLAERASELVGMTHRVQSRSTRVDVREAASTALRDYEIRASERLVYRGASMGMAEVDAHTHGIHDGELAIIAAGPKVGKSYLMAYIALKNWEAGLSPVLVTLENSVAMTLDRIACLAAYVDPRRWQRGLATPEEHGRVATWVNEVLEESDTPFHIIQPDLGQRTFSAITAEALVRDAGVLLVDQLTFIEHEGDGRRPKHERIGDSLHHFKGMISTGRRRIPAYLAHQINRDGVKAAEKLGYLEMYHLAEAAEVERTADWVWGLYASPDDRGARRAKLQTLAARREVVKNWELDWLIETGTIDTRRELTNLTN